MILLVLGGAALLLTHSSEQSSDVPKDANALLATVLAPSMVNVGQLSQFFDTFVAAAKNATNAKAQLRLGLYALVTALKKAMLEKGAQPDATELAAMSQSPATGMGGIQQLRDAPADAQQAAYAALVDSQQDPIVVNQYAAAIKAASTNANLTPAQKRRLLQYVLACKAKYVALQSGVALTAPIYFAIANANPVGEPTAASIISYA
jgi:hypothetical protein